MQLHSDDRIKFGACWALLAIALLSFAMRAACAIWFTGMIDGEGAEYARIAQNLLAGSGYVGMATDGTQLFFPPLFPFLIAAVSVLTGDAEIAGRVISVIMGSLIVVPVYLIALWMHGVRVAIGAAALVGFHPYLVQISTTVNSEPTYLTLVLMAIYMAMRAMDSPRARNFMAMGALYGMAYLVRPEALVYTLVSTAFIALLIAFRRDQQRLVHLSRLPLVAFGFLLFAGPYIVWLSLQVGELRIEGKSRINLATERLIQQGLPEDDAAFGVNFDLSMRGIWMQPSITAVTADRASTGDLARLLVKRAGVVSKDSIATLTSRLQFGSPFLFALAVIGLFARPWPVRLAVAQAHIVAILALVPIGLLFTYVLGVRFYILFVPFLCIWAAVGISYFSRWARLSAAVSGLAPVHRSYIEKASRAVAVLAIMLPAAGGAIVQLKSARDQRPFKQAVMNLASIQSTPMRIADTSTPAAFHAKADFVWLPYCDEDTALRFLAKRGVTHVVLRDVPNIQRPYLTKWIGEGIPNARLIVDIASRTGERFKIYQLKS